MAPLALSLPGIVLLALSASIELVSSSARVASVKSAKKEDDDTEKDHDCIDPPWVCFHNMQLGKWERGGAVTKSTVLEELVQMQHQRSRPAFTPT